MSEEFIQVGMTKENWVYFYAILRTFRTNLKNAHLEALKKDSEAHAQEIETDLIKVDNLLTFIIEAL